MVKNFTTQELHKQIEALKKEIALLRQNEISLREKKIAKNNEMMLRVSMALPEYTDLEDLLDYISDEVKRQLNTQGALVILLDEVKRSFFFLGAAYDDTTTKNRIKGFRFSIDDLASGEVIKTGKPIIVNDTSGDSDLYPKRDKTFGYRFENYALVPIKSSDRIIGVLAAFNKIQGLFGENDVDLLTMIAGTVALSIENARFSDELKKAYRELKSLDLAKNKAINHLSHELKTPVSIFSGTLSILEKKMAPLPEETWQRTLQRARRNVERIKMLQGEVNDIIQGKNSRADTLLSFITDQCADLFETLVADEVGEEPIVERVKTRIKKIFKTEETTPQNINLDAYVEKRLATLTPMFSHRRITITPHFHSTAHINIPVIPLEKTIDGLIRNAVENTPDQGKIDLIVRENETGVQFLVQDYGVGITREHQRRIFEGFFSTQDTAVYSSKKPFDFNAGGRGADLLRMKIFSERYQFSIMVASNRCRFIPKNGIVCPGNISECSFCTCKSDCYESGGAAFSLNFSTAEPMTTRYP